MQSIINSILKKRNLIIYIVLSLITFNSLYTNSSVHYSGIEKTATYLSGKSSIFSSYIYSYFNLRNKNQILIEENLQLKKIEYKNNFSSQNLENNSRLRNKVRKTIDGLAQIQFKNEIFSITKVR